MKYELSYTQKDGARVSGQIYTAEHISSMLAELESWGATNIVIRSNPSGEMDKYDIVLKMIDVRIADAERGIEKNKEYLTAELERDYTAEDIEVYASRIKELQGKIKALKDERERVEFLKDYNE